MKDFEEEEDYMEVIEEEYESLKEKHENHVKEVSYARPKAELGKHFAEYKDLNCMQLDTDYYVLKKDTE